MPHRSKIMSQGARLAQENTKPALHPMLTAMGHGWRRHGAIPRQSHESGESADRPAMPGTPFVKAMPMSAKPLSHAAIFLIAMLFPPSSASAQQPMICGQRDQIVARLQADFGEERRAMGLAGRNRIIEVFASDETGSWTITITGLDGITCLVAAGQSYESFAPAPRGQNL